MQDKIEVDVKTLKDKYPEEYTRAYEKWAYRDWDVHIDTEWYKESLQEKYKWLDVHEIFYSIAYSQGDNAFFTGNVKLGKFLDEHDTNNEYFVLREAMKMGDCAYYMRITSSWRRGCDALFEDIEWHGYDEWFVGEEIFVEGNSVLAGMPYGDYHEICMELLGDLYGWAKTVCEDLFDTLYKDIRAEVEYQTSEECFIEWAEAMDEKFEVEDESIGDAERIESCRIAA